MSLRSEKNILCETGAPYSADAVTTPKTITGGTKERIREVYQQI
jgi:hypothetical protein